MVSKFPYFSVTSIGWLAALLFGTLAPARELPDVGFNVNDKIIHLIIFLFLTLLLLIAASKENFLRIPIKKRMYFIPVIASCIALATEIAQNFIAGRQMDLSDMIANLAGVLIGAFIFRYLINNK